MDYKEYARQMRENCVKDKNGVIRCSPELWEQIASIIESTATQKETHEKHTKTHDNTPKERGGEK